MQCKCNNDVVCHCVLICIDIDRSNWWIRVEKDFGITEFLGFGLSCNLTVYALKLSMINFERKEDFTTINNDTKNVNLAAIRSPLSPCLHKLTSHGIQEMFSDWKEWRSPKPSQNPAFHPRPTSSCLKLLQAISHTTHFPSHSVLHGSRIV